MIARSRKSGAKASHWWGASPAKARQVGEVHQPGTYQVGASNRGFYQPAIHATNSAMLAANNAINQPGCHLARNQSSWLYAVTSNMKSGAGWPLATCWPGL